MFLSFSRRQSRLYFSIRQRRLGTESMAAQSVPQFSDKAHLVNQRACTSRIKSSTSSWQITRWWLYSPYSLEHTCQVLWGRRSEPSCACFIRTVPIPTALVVNMLSKGASGYQDKPSHLLLTQVILSSIAVVIVTTSNHLRVLSYRKGRAVLRRPPPVATQHGGRAFMIRALARNMSSSANAARWSP